MVLDEVQSKLDVLRSNLEQLDRIPLASLDEFSSDFRNVAASLYLLQTSIQALIDLGGYLVASKALPVPRTSQEVFERLEAAGLLPVGTSSSVAPIVGFRNRIVHLYDRVDTKRVYEILTKHRQDLPRLLHLLLAIDVE
jgi:uncharacterized protein YutE (UPF0331/DUF86 family)